MRKYFIPAYIALAAGVALVYSVGTSFMITTKPGIITVSNLTVNYVALSFLTGGLAGWYSYNRLLRRYNTFIRLVGTAVLVFIVAMLWLAIMSVGGYEMRWG